MPRRIPSSQPQRQRDKHDIIKDILAILANTQPLYRTWRNQTNIGHDADLTHPQTVKYLKRLVDEGLLILTDLALAYYKLGEYSNSLRIESFFSSKTVIVRILLLKDKVQTEDLKNQLKTILKQNNPTFDERVFEQDWNNCYPNERCSIAHGGVRNKIEYKVKNTLKILHLR
jgi:predicted transcriptional regulator